MSTEWDDVKPLKPWTMKRTDTGMETLVEDTDAEEVKKVDLEENPMPMTFHAIGERVAEREHGLGIQQHERVRDEPEVQNWRAFR
jgi:hypothetical protein